MGRSDMEKAENKTGKWQHSRFVSIIAGRISDL
jgi:hypothetical protein